MSTSSGKGEWENKEWSKEIKKKSTIKENAGKMGVIEFSKWKLKGWWEKKKKKKSKKPHFVGNKVLE